jgi:single-strand DNA-binding protein
MLNLAVIVGRLGNDPEIRHTSGGGQVVTFTVATSSLSKDKTTGERVEQTEWHRVVCFGQVAEAAGAYAHKGALVAVEGSTFTREFVDKTGATRKSTEIKANRVRVLSGKNDRAGGLGQGIATEDIPF